MKNEEDLEVIKSIVTVLTNKILTAAEKAYENARISGLCSEGAIELAIEKIKEFNLEEEVIQILKD